MKYKDIFEEATKAFREGKYDEAIELYLKCYDGSKDSFNRSNALYNVGVVYMIRYKKNKNRLDVDMAIDYFKMASDYKGKVSKAKMNEIYFNLSVCYALIENTGQAYIYMNMALVNKEDDEDTIKGIKKIEDYLFKKMLNN